MYVYDLNCDWTNHSFALREFKVTSQEQIDEIIKVGIEELYIDTRKGSDIECLDAEETNNFKESAEKEDALSYKSKPLHEELSNAVNVRNEMIKVLNSVFDNITQGKSLPMGDIKSAMNNMVHSFMSSSDASVGLINIRKVEVYTVEHAVNVAILMMAFEKNLTYDAERLMQVGLGGLLMDIGKARLPPYIVNKPSMLTEKEHAIACRHVQLSLEVLSNIPDVSDVTLQIVAEHHERMDGSGYPAGKKGDDISLYGQMAAIADAYDSLTSARAYKRGVSPHAALNRIIRNRAHYNNALAQQFVNCIGIYPVGSLVALSDGHFAVVVESEGRRLLCPKVRVFYNSLKRKYVDPNDVDIAAPENLNKVKIIGAIDPHKWNIKPGDFLDCADCMT